MQIGISTHPRGRLAGPAAARAVAQAAEQLGFSSIWVREEPRPSPDPDPVDEALDRLSVLVTAATVTTKVRIGAELRVEAWYPPDLLARSLLALDVLSEGRLVVGLGLGSHNVGGGVAARGGSVDDGGASDVRASTDAGIERVEALLDQIDAEPRQPLVLVSAADPIGLDRLVRRVRGWQASGVAVEDLGPRWEAVRRLFVPDPLLAEPILVVPVDVALTDRPITGLRSPYHGDVGQVAADLEAVGRAGADEVVLGVGRDCGLDETLDVFARVAEVLEARGIG